MAIRKENEFFDKKGKPLYFDPKEEVKRIVGKIREYFLKNGPNSKAIIGISGGKDSTITAALLVRALGKENVVGIYMPAYSADDFEAVNQVRECLGIEVHEMDITPILGRIYNDYCFKINDSIETNMPARIRMTILYMVAASVGGRVINTCNFSEDYVGYSTKYGDLAGDFSVLKNYTVREVLAIGDNLPELPENLVHKTPSDGMCGKTDEDNLGFSYEILDAFLLDYEMPEDFQVYKNIMTRHNQNLHKECINIPKISVPRALCPGRDILYKDDLFAF